jgi:chromosomal replication initiation ATPase DnaA
MLEKRLSGTIHRTVSRVAGRNLEVKFTVEGSNSDITVEKPRKTNPENINSRTIEQNGKIDYAKSYSLKNSFTFNTFIVGPSNRLAQAAAIKVTEAPEAFITHFTSIRRLVLVKPIFFTLLDMPLINAN